MSRFERNFPSKTSLFSRPETPVEPLGGLLKGLIVQLGVEERLAECRARLAWEEAVGAPLAAQAKPIKIDKGRLEIAVPSAVWRQQLNFMKRDIIKRLNELAGEEVVKDLVLLNRTPS